MGQKLVPIAFFCLSLLAFTSNGQDWKSHYDQAVRAYQNEQYDIALQAAELAYSQATDKKNKAYSLQLVTAGSLAIKQYVKSLRYINEEIGLFHELEGALSKNYAEALKKQATALEMNKEISVALQKIPTLISVIKSIYGEDHEEFGKVLLQHGSLMMQTGAYAEAEKILLSCIEKLNGKPKILEDYLTALYLTGLAETKLKSENSAQAKFKEYLHVATQNQLNDTEEYQRVKTLSREPLSNGSSTLTNDPDIHAGELAQQYLVRGLQHHEQLKYDSAIKNYRLCEEIVIRSSLQNKTTFSLYLNYATALMNTKDFLNAEHKLGKAKAVANKVFPIGDVQFGYLEKAGAELLLLQGNEQEAGKTFLQALTFFNTLQPHAKAIIVKNIATKLLNTNQPAFARHTIEWLGQDALKAIAEKEQTDIILLYAATFDIHEDAKAINYLSAQLQNLSEPESRARLQVSLADFYVRIGDSQKSIKLLQDITKQQNISLKPRADAAFQLGRIHQRLGQFNETEKYYETAIKIYSQENQRFHDELEEVSNSLAILYMTLGNYSAAEHLYNNLIKQTDRSSSFYSTLNQNLAAVYEQTSRYEGARILLEETLEHDKKQLGATHPDYAITLQNLGTLYLKTRQFEKAKELFIQALEIDKLNNAAESLAYASKLANLGTAYQELGELSHARDYYEKALAIRKLRVGKKHPDYIYNQYLLAVLMQRQKALDSAYPLFKSITEFYIEEINEVFPALSEIEKTAFYNKVNEVIIAYEDFAIEYGKDKPHVTAELYDFRLATKAILLNSLTKIRSRIIHSGDPELISKFNEWQHIKEKLAKAYTVELSERSNATAGTEALEAQANVLEKYLSSESELFADHRDKKNITWHQVKAALKPGEAAIEMIRLRLNQKNDSIIYAALVLQHNAPSPLMVLYPGGSALEGREFNMYKNCILYQVENQRSYTVYWKPLQSILKNIHTVYFSPDGIFNKINLQTLFDHESEKFLIDRISIKLVSNTREILDKTTNLAKPAQATLIGFPDFGSAAESGGSVATVQHLRAFTEEERADGIPALPGTQQELEKISKLLAKNQWEVKLYQRKDATEEKVKEQHSPAVLHIATHGFFIESSDQNSKVTYSRQIEDTESNPLLRSGLLLAGSEKHLFKKDRQSAVSSGTEDGILTALEAMNLNLDNTNLVVLSACETGAGQIKNGEGVFGLQRAFLVSGAQSVMMSLWKVNDEATQELMTEFYTQWLASGDRHDAFHKTQLKIKEKFPEPYYWGSFIMIIH